MLNMNTGSIAADFDWLMREFEIARQSGVFDASFERARQALREGVTLPPQSFQHGALNSIQSWQETLVTAQADGAAVSNTASATTLLPTPAVYTLPTNYFGYIGKALYVKAFGRLSTATGSAGTGQVTINLNTLTSPIAAFSSGTFALSGTATNLTWMMDLMLTCRSVGSGAAATLMGIGELTTMALAAATGMALLPASAPVVGTGFDSTLTNTFNLMWTFGTANVNNSIQLHEYGLYSLN